MTARSSPIVLRLATALWLVAVALCTAQSNILLREAVSREFSLHVGAISDPMVKEIVSREVTIQNGNEADFLSPELVSREFSLTVTTTDPPARIPQLTVDATPDGTQATLSWVGYVEFAEHDVAAYRIYVQDTPFTDVTPFSDPSDYETVPAGTYTFELTGLAAWQDHYFAVVPVDQLDGFDTTVDYAASYVQGAELISREFSLHNGGVSDPVIQQLVSRELQLAVTTTAVPEAITQLLVDATPTGEVVTLSWTDYNEIEQQDVSEYRVFVSDQPFTDVGGMTAVETLPAGTKAFEVSGLTAWQDYYFAVVAVDLLGGFDSSVQYAANYVLSREVVTREFTLHNGGISVPVQQHVLSREISFLVPDDAVPEPVTGVGSGFTVEISTVAYKAVDLTWPNYDEVAQKDVVAYRIYVGPSYFSDVSAMDPYQRIDGGISGCTVGGLESNTVYHFAVVAEDAGGRFSPIVHSVSQLTSPGGVSAVQDLAVETGETSLIYTWSPPAEGNIFLKHYEVFLGGATDPVILVRGVETYTAAGLQAAHAYTLQIVAVDIFGNDAGSSSISGATWLANPTPTKKELDGSVRLMWAAVEPGALLKEYAIYQSDTDFTDVGAMAPVATTTGTRETITGLTNLDTYYFAVVAINTSDGFSPTVAALAAVPQPDVKGARVVAAVPSGAGAAGAGVEQVLQSFTVTFDDVMDAASFTADDVVVTAPARAEVTVLGVTALSETAFRVSLADAVAAGTYTVTVGPDILDEADNPMDQDDDGVNGEVDDAYSFDIVLSNPGLPVGTGDGLLAEYFSDENKGGTSWRQREATVNHTWAGTAPFAGVPADHFSAVWTGELEVRFDADYTFRLLVDDGARLWLNDVLVIDGWNGSRGELLSAPVVLTKGRHTVRLEYVERTDNAEIEWQWSCPFFAAEVVPQSQLYSGLAEVEFAATPSVAPAGGTVTSATDITLASTTAGASLYYALAAADPDVPGDWTLYDGGTPIHLLADATLRAFATKDNHNRSGVLVTQLDLQETELSGVVWSDLNSDAVPDGGEALLRDRLLFLDTNDDQLWTAGEVSTRTAAGGTYTLRTPLGGTHHVRIALVADDRLSVPVAAFPGYDVATVPGQLVGGLDFGLLDGVAPTATFDLVVANALPAQFTGTIDDPTATIQVAFNGTTLGATNVGDDTWQVATAGFGAAGDGSHDVDLIVEDDFGNEQTITVSQAVKLSTAVPAVESVSPLLIEGQALARIEVTFDSEIDPDSLQPENFVLQYPAVREAIPGTLVRLEGNGTLAVVQFPAQTANGTYQLTVGPEISNIFGNPMAGAYQQNLNLKLPDLLAKDVVVTPATLQADTDITIAWKEENVGLLTASNSWQTTFYLLPTTRADEGEILLGSVASAGELTVGQELAREHTLRLPAWIPAGSGLRIRAEANEARAFLEADWGNNAALSQSLQMQAALSFQLVAATVAEDASSLGAEVWRNGDLSAPLTVTLGIGPAGGASAPATVEIAAGSTSVAFLLTIADDALVTGDRELTLTGTAAGTASGEARFTIVEDDTIALQLVSTTSTNVLESEDLTIRLIRDDAAGLGAPLSVAIGLSVTHQVLDPGTVVIPAGETETTFLVRTINDDDYEQIGSVILMATAPASQDVDLKIDVFDDDEPTVTVRLDRDSCSEGDGSQAIAGVISRGERAGADLRVRLEVDDANSLLVPSEVIIPAGLAEVAFSIGAVDNTALDGDRDVQLTVSGLMSDCGCAATSRRTRQVSIVEKTITVRDDDAAGLRLTVDKTVAQEGVVDAFAFTLSRNTATDTEVVVALSADPAGEVQLPASATLAVGESEVSFTADTLDDAVQDGTETVLVRAEAAGLTTAEVTVSVTDLQLPDLVITAVSGDAQVVSGNTFTMRFTIVNQGQGVAENSGDTETEGWVQRVYLSPDPYIGDDQLIGNYRLNAAQPPGAEWAVSQTVSAFAPPVNGEYWVVAVADVNGDIDEILETNNARISDAPVVVSASYEATVQTSFESGLAALTLADVTPILLSGTATYLADGSPAASVPVHVHINVRDYERTLLAITDLNGQYTCTFRPLPGEGGEYSIGACHPGDPTAPEQDSFTIVGMRAEPATAAISVPVGETVAAAFKVHNLSEVPLVGLTASLVGAPGYMHAALQLSATDLGALGSVDLDCEFEADDPGALQDLQLALRVEATGGAAVDIPLDLTVRPLKAVLVVTSGQVYAGMQKGEQTLVQVMLENQGAVNSGAISVDLPAADWLGLGTENPMAGIAAGESAALVLSLTPAAGAAFARYEGSFVLTQEHGDELRIPFEFRVVSDAVGDLEVTTINQFYYYAKGAPTMPGAAVQILDGFTGVEVAQAVSDAQGVALFPALPEGYYTVLARAEKHREHREIVFVSAGRTTSHLAYMIKETVEITWTVEQVELEDRVEVIVETTFETNVPAPVVTIDPPVIDLGGLTTVGQIERITMTISNHGLISAKDLKLHVGTHPYYSIEPLTTEFGDLPAMGSVTVPVVLRRIGDATTVRADRGAGCGIPISASFILCKGTDSVGVGTSNIDGDCGGGFLSGGGAGSGSGGISGGSGGSGKSICACIVDGDCPCITPYLDAGLSCVINFIPGFDFPKCLYGAYGCGNGLLTLNISVTSLTGCAGAALDCAAAAGRTVPGLGQVIGGINCLSAIYDAIKECNPGRAASAQAVYTDLLLLLDGAEGHHKFFLELYGDEKWLDYTLATRRNWERSFLQTIDARSADGFRITAGERTLLLSRPAGPAITQADKQALIDRYNNTDTYLQNGWVAAADVPGGMSRNFIDMTALNGWSKAMNDANDLARSLGYDGYMTAVKAELEKMNRLMKIQAYAVASSRRAGGGGECAKVKLLLSQDVVLAHEGFEATLKIENAESLVLTDLGAEVKIYDADGNEAGSLLAIGDPALTQFTALDGSGVLTAGKTGTARWLIVPRAEAAPLQETTYYVGGVLNYSMGDTNVTIPLAPVEITVHPQPELHLEYYHQRDVFSDDPWTDEVEPSRPYELAVLVRNTGVGEARKLKIISGKPQIVENEKGLLIDFQLIGHEIDGQSMSPALTATFGDLPGGDSAVARWWMTSTLQGQFTEYKATLSHTSPLGDPRLSQIKDVSIFELIHSVELAGELAFLTNDEPDDLDLPDTIHQQDGAELPVNPVDDSQAIVTGTLAPTQLEVTLETPAVAGWNYLRLADRDPGGGEYVLVEVRDANRASLPSANYWQTDRTFEMGGVRPVLEDNLHLLFAGAGTRAQETFTLVYRSADQVGPVVRDLSLPPAAVVSEPQDEFLVGVSEPVDLSTLTKADFQLTRNGGAVSVPDLTPALVSATSIRVTGFSSANGVPGTYRLALSGVGLTDAFGNAGLGSVETEWTVSPDGPVPVTFVVIGDERQNFPLDACEITFSQDIDLATVGVPDLQLFHDEAEVTISELAFAAVGSDGLRISDLQAYATAEGAYRLVFDATGITSATGVTGFGTKSVTWEFDQTGPGVTATIPVEPPIVNTTARVQDGLDHIRIVFSEPVRTGSFTLSTLRLSRNSAPVPLPAGAALTTTDGQEFRLSGIYAVTAAEGTYVLRIDQSAIYDEAGNAGVGAASETWVNDATAPQPPSNLQLSPDTGELDDDGVTMADTFTLSGDLSETGLEVEVLGFDGPALAATVTGTEFTLAMAKVPGGSYPLTIIARDASGNEAQAQWTVFVDAVDLSAGLALIPSVRSSVAGILADFSAPIAPDTFTVADLALFQDGLPLALGAEVSIALQDNSDDAYEITGLPLPIDAGLCELRLDLTGVDKTSSGRNGTQTVQITWQNQGALQNLDLTPRSPLSPASIIVTTRTPTLVGTTPLDWLTVIAEDELGTELARTEVADGTISLPLTLLRDGDHSVTVRGVDASDIETSRDLEFVVDTRAPEILESRVERTASGEIRALHIRFSEDMDLQSKIDDGSITALITLQSDLVRGRTAVPLLASEMSWDNGTFVLSWAPTDPLALAPATYQVSYDIANITDFAGHSLADPGAAFGFVVARSQVVDGTPTALDALGPAGLTYRWDFGDGSATVDGPSVTHSFAANGEFEIWMTVFDGAESLFRHVTTLTRGTGNQTPVLDLDLLTDGNDALARICPLEQEAPLLRRPRLLLADGDSRTLAQVTLELADPVAGEGELLLAPETLPDGVSASYDAVDSILTLTGPASPGTFADVLAGVRYYNATEIPAANDRFIAVVADDGKAQVQRTITVQTRDRLRLYVQPGWALYSLPLTPVQADIPTVFGDGLRALLVRDWVFAWNPQRLRYWPIDSAQGQQGVWAFSEVEEETETNESAGFCARNDLSFVRGWNLWGPAEEVSVAELIMAQPGLSSVWKWDPAARNYQKVETNDILERGRAYWLFMYAL